MTAMPGLLRKLCSASVPILGKARAFSSSYSSTATAPLLLIPTRNLFSGEKNGKLSESYYPYCLFSLADLSAGDDTNKKKVLMPKEKLLPQDKELLFPDDLRYIGSSRGLVACVHPRSLKVFLFNALSPSNSITLLPPLPDLASPDYIEYFKLIMSAPPSDPECRVLVLDSLSHETCFWTPGDESWTPLEAFDEAWAGESDIVYSKRDECFYHNNEGEILVAWDLSDPGSPTSSLIRTGFACNDTVEPEYNLAESPSSGDLYLVWRSMYGAETEASKAMEASSDIDPNTVVGPYRLGLTPENMRHEFRVYKLNSESRWDEAEAFDDTLFLGKNHSFFWPAQPNSIYFTENHYTSYNTVLAFDPKRHRVCDMLIKDCSEWRGRPSRYYFRDSEDKGTELNPIWVMAQSSTASLVERFVHTCQYKPPPPLDYSSESESESECHLV